MEELLMLITNQGFAIAIASYCLVTLNKSLKENTESNNLLREEIRNGRSK